MYNFGYSKIKLLQTQNSKAFVSDGLTNKQLTIN